MGPALTKSVNLNRKFCNNQIMKVTKNTKNYFFKISSNKFMISNKTFKMIYHPYKSPLILMRFSDKKQFYDKYDSKSQQQEKSRDNQKQTYQKINNPDQLYKIGRHFYSLNQYQKAIKYFEKALQIYQKQQGKQSVNVGKTLSQIGIISQNQGSYERALQCYTRLIKIYQKIKGQKDIGYASMLHNIGNVYFHQKKLQEALKFYEQALKIKIQIKGKQDIEVIKQINSIAGVNSMMKDYDKAIQQVERALKISVQAYGQNSIQNTFLLNNLGKIYYFNKNNKQKGMQCFLKSLNFFKTNNVKRHINYAYVLSNLGEAHLLQQRYQQGLQYLQQSKQMFENMIGKNNRNPHYINICNVINLIKNDIKNIK